VGKKMRRKPGGGTREIAENSVYNAHQVGKRKGMKTKKKDWSDEAPLTPAGRGTLKSKGARGLATEKRKHKRGRRKRGSKGFQPCTASIGFKRKSNGRERCQ